MSDADQALFLAARAADPERVRAAIGAGGRAGLADRDGDTPLHALALGRDHQNVDPHTAFEQATDCARLLLAAGADAEAESSGRAPLHFAAMDANLPVLRALLALGCSVVGALPPTAMSAGNAEPLALLLEAGADILEADQDGFTALAHARDKPWAFSDSNMVELLEAAELRATLREDLPAAPSSPPRRI